MKRIRSLLILTICLLCSIFFITGCSDGPPIKFNSVLSINTDESGCRTITASASKETIKDILGSKNNSFQSFVDAYCPEEVDWEYVETEDTYELTFLIYFQTLDEYQNKVGNLTGNPASVTVSRPQVGVTTGFTLTENTTVTDLFSWLFSALSERSGLSQSKLQNKLLNGTNVLVYAGREYPSKNNGLYAYVETLHDAEYIDILTDLSIDNVWKRTVNIHFPGDMLDNAANVKPYLSSLLPEGVSETWSNDITWSLSFEDGDIKKIGTLMRGLFQSQTNEMLSESIFADNSMQITHHYQEPLNLAFFVPNKGQTTVRYFIRTPERASLYYSAGNGSLIPAESLSNDYGGYTCLFSQSMSVGTLDFTVSYQYQPLEILVQTEVRAVQDIRRTTTLEMGTVLPEPHRALMIETLTRDANTYGSIKEETTNGLYRIYFEQSGTAAHINEGFSAVFNGGSSFSYQRPTLKLFDATLKASFSDRIDFTSFLANPSETLITYSLTFPNEETLTDGTESFVVLTTDGLYQPSGETTRPNKLRPWLFALFTVLGILVLFFILAGPVRKNVLQNQKNKRRQVSKKYPQKKNQTAAKRKTTSGSKSKNGQKKQLPSKNNSRTQKTTRSGR